MPNENDTWEARLTRDLTGVGAALDQIRAEQRAQVVQLVGLTAITCLVAGMIWRLNHNLLEVASVPH